MRTNQQKFIGQLSVNGDNLTYFDSLAVEHIPKETKNIIGNKNTTKNIIEYKELIQ